MLGGFTRATVSALVCACLSDTVEILPKRLNGSSWFLACRLSFTYRTLYKSVLGLSGKCDALKIIGSLSQTLKLEKFRHVDRRNVLST